MAVAVAVAVLGVLLLVAAVDRDRPLDDVDGQEAGREHQQRLRHPVDLLGRLVQRLREEVEGDHPEHQPGGEAEHQVPAVAGALRDPAADQRHQEGPRGHQDRGHRRTAVTVRLSTRLPRVPPVPGPTAGRYRPAVSPSVGHPARRRPPGKPSG